MILLHVQGVFWGSPQHEVIYTQRAKKKLKEVVRLDNLMEAEARIHVEVCEKEEMFFNLVERLKQTESCDWKWTLIKLPIRVQLSTVGKEGNIFCWNCQQPSDANVLANHMCNCK